MNSVVMEVSHLGVVSEMTLPVFIPQLLSSRNKNLNGQAQMRALAEEKTKLGQLQGHMASNELIDSSYEILGLNKELIQNLNQNIEDTLKKKFDLIQWYASTVLKESLDIVNGKEMQSELINNRLSQEQEVERELKFYDSELDHLQRRRANLWDADAELQDKLLSQEKKRNGQLDASFRRYMGMLEKMYLRYDKNNENNHTVDKRVLKKTTTTSQFLASYFNNSSSNVSCNQAQEIQTRCEIAELENAINGKNFNSNVYAENDIELSPSYGKNHRITQTV